MNGIPRLACDAAAALLKQFRLFSPWDAARDEGQVVDGAEVLAEKEAGEEVAEPRECECWPVDNPWTYYGIVEPGGAMEFNPDCPVHRITDAERRAWEETAEGLADAAEKWTAVHCLTCDVVSHFCAKCGADDSSCDGTCEGDPPGGCPNCGSTTVEDVQPPTSTDDVMCYPYGYGEARWDRPAAPPRPRRPVLRLSVSPATLHGWLWAYLDGSGVDIQHIADCLLRDFTITKK